MRKQLNIQLVMGRPYGGPQDIKSFKRWKGGRLQEVFLTLAQTKERPAYLESRGDKTHRISWLSSEDNTNHVIEGKNSSMSDIRMATINFYCRSKQ